jgi:polysaccharide biosynthesis/export protein
MHSGFPKCDGWCTACAGTSMESIAKETGDRKFLRFGRIYREILNRAGNKPTPSDFLSRRCRIYLACQRFCTVNNVAMTQDRRQIWHDRQMLGSDMTLYKRTLRPSYVFTLLLFAVLGCGGCQNPLPPLPNPPGPYTAVRLSPGDVLKLSFAEETDLDQVQKIRRDGKISLPFLGEVTAAGKRVIDFQHELTRRFEEHLDNPEVLVTLEHGLATVIISGFANRPGPVQFDRPTTVYQAIMGAGGVSDYGSLSNIHLTRVINGVQQTERISLRSSIRGQPVQPKYVQDGDVIYIARSLF